MKIKVRTVKVHEVPRKVTAMEERTFLRNLYLDLDSERPRFVLDCSKVESMSVTTIRLLLSCLEIAMKRNGDVRLASLPADAEASLRLTGVDRLFETYATAEEAVQSFHKRPSSLVPQPAPSEDIDNDSRYAA
jgi:anti-anti-sigma factor